jgi:hypothetical protein
MSNPNPSPATRWKKGQSGNPKGGRPTPLTNELRKLLQTPADGSEWNTAHMIVWGIVQQAKAGNVQAARLLWEYIEGKAVQPTEVSGPGGGGLEIVIRRVDERAADAGTGTD